MPPQQAQFPERLTLTASLTTGVARVTHGLQDSTKLIEEVLRTNHVDWETTLLVGDDEFYHTKTGPVPNHQMRVSARPSANYAALNYMDHDDTDMPIANSHNPQRPLPEVNLIFNSSTGSIFPRRAAIPISRARAALTEWLQTRKRPFCIEWRPYDEF